MTLHEILRSDVHSRPTRRQRYALSLTLASSFLQLLDTPWLPVSYETADILFYPDADDPSAVPLYKPYLSHDVRAPDPGTTSGDPETADVLSRCLIQLGILLLELCFGDLLSEQRCRRAWGEGGTQRERRAFDLMAARKWLCEVEGEGRGGLQGGGRLVSGGEQAGEVEGGDVGEGREAPAAVP